jgi:uncharacterized protein
MPVLLPVNYAIDGDTILVRSEPGAKLDAAARRSPVAFEVDETDAFDHSGWSVLVQGHVEEVTDDPELDRLEHLDLHPWAGEKSHLLRIVPQRMSGRRVSRFARRLSS